MYAERTRHVDESEEDGYHYEYDIYRFTDGALCFVARSYVEDACEAHFLRAERRGRPRYLRAADLRHPLFLAALDHLRGEGKTRHAWLCPRTSRYRDVSDAGPPWWRWPWRHG
ncbi:hypothetical protein LDO32_10690 [Luteimonas sp. Y-2-2-4F]|nr:hypothetical protein [Luteimonas sp. Y-2-2-4F]MCD9032189.1 hypothetical protein [Luteimonas sp. Y-2-2-4F]